MFSVKSTVLTAALVGHGALSVAAQGGCYPSYSSGSNYVSGSQVSATVTTTSQTTAPCTNPGSSSCPLTGQITTTTTTVTTFNYQCVSNANSAFCNNIAYAPGDIGTNPSAVGVAWTQIAECSGAAPSTPSTPATPATPGPTPALWSGGGCPGVYSVGSDYSAGDTVTVVGTSFSTVYQCNPAPADAWCGQAGYEPGTSLYWAQAWTALGSCSGTIAPTSSPVFTALDNAGGCPAAYSASTVYEEGDSISRDGLVYECNSGSLSLHCSQDGYEPGTSIGSGANIVEYWRQAWNVTGFCSGTIAPTSSPVFTALADAGGCPAAYSASAVYEEGDSISRDGLVYECNSGSLSLHCSQDGYEPGTSIGSGANIVEDWKLAWTVTGFCSGTIAPTSSPVFTALADAGGCPNAWVTQVYEEGDRVSDGSLVYQCKAWPFSGHCGQAGYEPNVNPATPGAWKDAWTVVGSCSGTITPTTAPNFNPANSVGACPDEWVAGSNVAYEEGDMVSLTVSTIPIRKVVFRCKAWPFSGFCGQLAPDVFGGDQGWEPAGSCDGSMGPTASPSFDVLNDVGMGCPTPWSGSVTDYEAGDLVSFAFSDAPERKIVYECRSWPNSGYCNQGSGFQPGTQNSDLAWILRGYCDGTLAPTASPAVFFPDPLGCTFTRCIQGPVAKTCTNGQPGCVCTGTGASQVCTRTIQETNCYSGQPVNPWSTTGFLGNTYKADDVVRVGAMRFKCRGWPNELWCPQEVYRPTREANGLWTNAWTLDGVCASGVTTITLGQDVDYPPYATQTATGELGGFGKDFADGMTALCDDLEIVVVEERWANCWSSAGGGTLGAHVADGTLDGCMTYTHTKGVRDELADFSDAILGDNKPAGLLTLLDNAGNPKVSGMEDLEGRTIIDVGGWAPTADGLELVTNFCLNSTYSKNVTLVVAVETNGSGANDVAMRMLRDGEGDAIFLYADQARDYLECPEKAAWNCTLWEGLGTDYAYVQTGQFGYAVNGTTLALSRKGSGIRELLRPCLSRFMETKEYYDICVKHGLVGDCYKNEFFADFGNDVDKPSMPTNLQTGDCTDGYCPC